jgi:hypothetical protein
MTTLYCALCEQRFEPDDDHVALDAETKLMNDRNGREDYVLHPSCWDELTEDWVDPV